MIITLQPDEYEDFYNNDSNHQYFHIKNLSSIDKGECSIEYWKCANEECTFNYRWDILLNPSEKRVILYNSHPVCRVINFGTTTLQVITP